MVYVVSGEQIIVRAMANAANTIGAGGRILTLDQPRKVVEFGGFVDEGAAHTMTTSRAVDIPVVEIPATGELVNFVVSNGSAAKRGNLFANPVLKRGAASLASGYVYDNHPVQLGSFSEPGPGGGEGLHRTISLGDPAAGAEYTGQTVPNNAVWRVEGFSGTLVTDVTAANRFFRLGYGDGTNILGTLGGVSNAHTASLTLAYRGQMHLGTVAPSSLTNWTYLMGLANVFLPEGYTVDPTTNGIVAGDNWGAGFLDVEEWLVV